MSVCDSDGRLMSLTRFLYAESPSYPLWYNDAGGLAFSSNGIDWTPPDAGRNAYNTTVNPGWAPGRYGNLDIIWDHFSRISQLHPTPHALWAVFYM